MLNAARISQPLVRALFLLCFITFSLTTAFGAGEVDPTFNASIRTEGGEGYVTELQPDGKILVGGLFTTANEAARSGIARFNTDGTLDNSFDVVDISGSAGQGGKINAIGLQSDGKIIVGGDFKFVNGVLRWSVARLNADGSLDESFNSPLTPQHAGSAGEVFDLKVYADGRIIIAGDVRFEQGGTERRYAIRLLANGSVDLTFQMFNAGGAKSVSLQADGRVLIGGVSQLRRVEANGLSDDSFPPVNVTAAAGGEISKILIKPDGKILIGGTFAQLNGFNIRLLARINLDGSIDASFNSNNFSGGAVNDIEIDNQGRIYAGGGFSIINSVLTHGVARFNADGVLDAGFVSSVPVNNIINDVSLTSDGKVIAAGITSGAESKIFRLNSNGSVDAAFNASIGKAGSVFKVFVQADGKILVGGRFKKANSTDRTVLARFNADGTLDTGFSDNFGGNYVFDFEQQPDGKILVAGQSNQSIRRLNLDGSVDTSFDAGFLGSGPLREIALQPDGKILIGYRRLNTDGSNDASFAPVALSGVGVIFDLALQPDGKILIAGDFTAVNGTPRGRIARLNSDGTLDTSFATTLGANNAIYNLALQSDGKVVIGGYFTGVNGANRNYVARLNADGTLDTGFTTTANAWVNAVTMQTDGKILIGGAFSNVNGTTRTGAARLNADGSTDVSFTANANNAVNSFAFQSDGKIIMGGTFSRANNISRVGLVRLLNTNTPRGALFDYDGDGKADVSVVRPSTGYWYLLNSGNGQVRVRQFYSPPDILAPADYDGDGKFDIAHWRPWHSDQSAFSILESSTNLQRYFLFGSPGDVPVPADWDGDGKADLAVYRAASQAGGQSYFFYRPSSQPGVNFITIAWGTAEDKPVVGDFDGDGRQDAAVFRPSNGGWYILQSSNNQIIGIGFGIAEDKPVAADYDGDGKTDIAVFRPSTGSWYRINSTNNQFVAVQFGTAGDIPVAADYDGDAKADIAVFRLSNGNWYQQRSTQGFATVQFGQNGDLPTEAAYIR